MTRIKAAVVRAVLAAGVIAAGVIGSHAAQASTNGLALSPPLGWTSWSSLQTDIDEDTIKAMAEIQAAVLGPSGYVYVNVDGGWYANPDAEIDPYGRWVADAGKFPGGMKALGDYIHGLGLKFGIYVTPGIPALAWVFNTPIEGTPYHAADIAIPGQRQATYLGGTMFYIDYTAPGSQEFVNSWANLFASWGVDYLKLDAVGDWNIPDVRAWSMALQQTGRPMHLELSNDLSPAFAATWRQHANGWRISPDIEAYNGVTLTDWEHVALRFARAPQWLGAGASGGWNDLDSLAAGGTRTGLTHDERRTMVTLWALCASPLIVGDDLRTLDAFGIALLTNPEVIGVNQNGVVAAPLNTAAAQQAWVALQPDGSYVVGLFNLGTAAATVSVSWPDVGFAGPAAVRDLWARSDLGLFPGGFSAPLDAHASMMLRITPAAPVRRVLASAGTVSAWAFHGSSPVSPGGRRAQYVGFGSALTFPAVTVTHGGWYTVTINYINGDAAPRGAVMTVNGGLSWIVFPAAGDWGAGTTSRGITTAAFLVPGANQISFWNPVGWAPDFAGITLQPRDPAGPVYYQVINALTGKLLDDAVAAAEAGMPIIQMPDSGAPTQHWQMIAHGTGRYAFVSRVSGLALDLFAASALPGLQLVRRPHDGGPHQRWLPVAAANGAVVLINEANGRLVHASPDWNGAKVDQWIPTGEADVQWIIVPVM